MVQGPENLSQQTPDDEVFLSTHRSRWVKRSAWLAVAIALLLVLLQFAWSHEAKRRAAKFIAEAHARGEPVVLEDFIPPRLPDAQNAAILLGKAERLIQTAKLQFVENDAESTRWDRGQIFFSLPFPQKIDDLIVEWMKWHGEILPLVRAARRLGAIDWGDRFIARSSLQNQRRLDLYLDFQLADAAIIAAFHEHAIGNDAEAIGLLRDALFIAQAAESKLPVFRSHAAREVIEFTVIDALQMLNGELSIQRVGRTRPEAKPASREQINDLVAEMLDELSLKKGLVNAYFGERMMTLEFSSFETQQRLGTGWIKIAHPWYELEALRTARAYTTDTNTARAASWPAAASMLPTFTRLRNEDSRLTSQMGSLFPSHDDSIKPDLESGHFRLIAERRLVAVLLAAHLWSVDHDGKEPGALSELVPNYLRSVPVDPFSVDGSVLSHSPEQDPPVIYSAGSGFIPPSPGIFFSFPGDQWGIFRVFRAPADSTKTENNDKDAKENARQHDKN